jgi:hypothetical protein
MGVISDQLLELDSQGRALIKKEFGVQVTAEIRIGTSADLVPPIRKSFTERAPHLVSKIESLIPDLDGIYLKDTHEIWIVQGRGENFQTILHEMLHSIQKCFPNRENIVDFLVYKLTGLSDSILPEVLTEWIEIEKSIGLKNVKTLLLSEGDCEEF